MRIRNIESTLMTFEYFEERRKFLLTTRNTAYLFQLSENDELLHLYCTMEPDTCKSMPQGSSTLIR